MGNVNCDTCRSNKIELVKEGLHYQIARDGSKVLKTQKFKLYHCNACNNNFEIKEGWKKV